MRLSAEKIETIRLERIRNFCVAPIGGMNQFKKNHGFTMVELISVMVIIGILAAVALPKFFDRGTFDSRGFADQVKATLRYAQKTAIAQRHFVCVAFTANSITLTYDPISPSTAHTTAACTGNLTSPSGQTPYIVTSPTADVTLSGAAFYFDALGRPFPAQSITAGGTAITVEAETGYVH